jgi:hypothetical protein
MILISVRLGRRRSTRKVWPLILGYIRMKLRRIILVSLVLRRDRSS